MSIRNQRLVLLIIVTLGALLRFLNLGGQSLWLDEYTTLEVARRSFGDILAGVGFDRHTPPLYYLLIHCWLQFFPENEFWLRAPSALFDVFNIFLVFIAARALLVVPCSIFAALLYAVSPFAIYYAQEARMYSLIIFLLLVSLLLFWRLLSIHWSKFEHLLFALVAIAGCYTHYYYCLFLAALALLGFVVLRREQRKFVIWALTLLIIGVSYLPWLQIVFALVQSGGQHFRDHLWLVLPYTLFRFIYGYAVFPITQGYKATAVAEILGRWWIFLPPVLFFATAFMLGLRRGLSNGGRGFLMIWCPPLIVLLMAIGLSLKAPMLSERYLSTLFPFFLLILANGSQSTVIRGALLTTSLLGTIMYFVNEEYGKAQWREVGATISSEVLRGDRLVVSPGYLSGVLSFYLRDTEPSSSLFSVDQRVGQPEETWLQFKENATTAVEAEGAKYSSKRIWLVESADTPSLEAQVRSEGFTPVTTRLFPRENGIRVELYSKRNQ